MNGWHVAALGSTIVLAALESFATGVLLRLILGNAKVWTYIKFVVIVTGAIAAVLQVAQWCDGQRVSLPPLIWQGTVTFLVGSPPVPRQSMSVVRWLVG